MTPELATIVLGVALIVLGLGLIRAAREPRR